MGSEVEDRDMNGSTDLIEETKPAESANVDVDNINDAKHSIVTI